MTDDQQRATELQALMQEFEAASVEAGYPAPDRNQQGDGYLWQRDHDRFVGFELATALRAAPEGFGSVSPVDHVRYWAEAYGSRASGPHFQGHGKVHALLTEYADLLERLAGRPQG